MVPLIFLPVKYDWALQNKSHSSFITWSIGYTRATVAVRGSLTTPTAARAAEVFVGVAGGRGAIFQRVSWPAPPVLPPGGAGRHLRHLRPPRAEPSRCHRPIRVESDRHALAGAGEGARVRVSAELFSEGSMQHFYIIVDTRAFTATSSISRARKTSSIVIIIVISSTTIVAACIFKIKSFKG